jgi:hypothetical protein
VTATAAEPPVRLEKLFCVANGRFLIPGSCSEGRLLAVGCFRFGSAAVADSFEKQTLAGNSVSAGDQGQQPANSGNSERNGAAQGKDKFRSGRFHVA